MASVDVSVCTVRKVMENVLQQSIVALILCRLSVHCVQWVKEFNYTTILRGSYLYYLKMKESKHRYCQQPDQQLWLLACKGRNFEWNPQNSRSGLFFKPFIMMLIVFRLFWGEVLLPCGTQVWNLFLARSGHGTWLWIHCLWVSKKSKTKHWGWPAFWKSPVVSCNFNSMSSLASVLTKIHF